MKKKYDIVIDGGIIHDNGNLNDKGYGRKDPNRLVEIINRCESKGYDRTKVVVIMKTDMYKQTKKYPDEGVGNPKILDDLVNSGNLQLIDVKGEEDPHWIDLATRHGAFMITTDTFRNPKYERKDKQIVMDEDGNRIVLEKSVRERFPDWNWTEIDSRTIRPTWGGIESSVKRTFSWIGGEFIVPDLPSKPSSKINQSGSLKTPKEIGKLEYELSKEKTRNKLLSRQVKALQERPKENSIPQKKPFQNQSLERQIIPVNVQKNPPKELSWSKLLKHTKIGKYLVKFGVKYTPHRSNHNRAYVSVSITSGGRQNGK